MRLSVDAPTATPGSEVKISPVQLSFLLTGFLFGSSAILNPATAARQDAWLAFLLGWAGGVLLIGIYIAITRLNPGKTLVDILIACFGKILGTAFSLLYIWYFIHLAALIIRNFGEYMTTMNYPKTPLLFLAITLVSVSAYSVRKGLETTGRTSEIFIPFLPLSVIFLFFFVYREFNPANFLPVLENGLKPVVNTGLIIVTFPFGQSVVFLTLFANLSDRKKLTGSVIVSVLIVGIMLLAILARDIMALGPDILERALYAPDITSRLVTYLTIYPVISVSFLIGGGTRTAICIYGAATSIARIAKLDNYVPLVMPISALAVTLSIWVFETVLEMFEFAKEAWFYYSLPFQVIIPVLVLIISFIKRSPNTQKPKR